MKKFTRGFTLIELLVVIAIIGILASIVLVSLNGARKKGNDTRVISDVQEIRTALETDYNGTNYGSAVGTGDLQVNAFNTTTGTSTSINSLIADAIAEGGTITVTTNGAFPITSYAVYGALPSQAGAKYFCISSAGATAAATSTPVNNETNPC